MSGAIDRCQKPIPSPAVSGSLLSVPLPLLMLLGALAIGIGSGRSGKSLLHALDAGFGSALLPSLGVSPEAATLAMCAGAFACITPNDSLYWQVRQDALAGHGEAAAMRVLTMGSALQGMSALLTVWAMQYMELI